MTAAAACGAWAVLWHFCLPDWFPRTREEEERLYFELQQEKPAKSSACSQAAHCPEVPQLQFPTSYTACYHRPSSLLNWWYKLHLSPAKLTLQFPATTFLLCPHYRLTPPCLLLPDLRCCSGLTFLPSLPAFLASLVPAQCLSNHICFSPRLHPTSTLTPACLASGTDVVGNLWFHVPS